MSNSNNKIPWAKMFRCAVVFLGVRPQDFWNMTIKELSYLLNDQVQDQAEISRKQLNEMINEMNKYYERNNERL